MNLEHDLKAAIRKLAPSDAGRDTLLRLYATHVGNPEDALPSWEWLERDERGRFEPEEQ